MKISIKKTIDDEIEIETPAFYYNDSISTFCSITDRCVILVSNDQITHVSKESISGTWYESEIQRAISKEKITEAVFIEMLSKTQEKINNACGLSPVPTIFTQNKFGMFQKALVAIIFFICFSFSSFAQPYASMEAGTGIGINIGYSSGVVIQAGLNVPYTRRSDRPHIFYGSIGYEFGNNFTIIPSIGISRFGITDFSKGNPNEIKKTALLTSLEIGKNFETNAEHFGRYYLFIRNSVKVFAGAGLKIFIK